MKRWANHSKHVLFAAGLLAMLMLAACAGPQSAVPAEEPVPESTGGQLLPPTVVEPASGMKVALPAFEDTSKPAQTTGLVVTELAPPAQGVPLSNLIGGEESFSAISLTPEPASNGRARYVDPGGFFTLETPASWTQHRSGSEIQFWADEEGRAGLAASIQIKAVSPRATVARISEMLATRWDGYREVDGGDTEMGGFPAFWVEQTYRFDGQPYHGLMAAIVRNRVGILLIAWSPESRFGELGPTFEDISDTLAVASFPEAPDYEQWLTKAAGNLVFHYLPRSYAAQEIDGIAAAHQEAFGDIVRTLGVRYDGPIHFFLYPSAESLFRATARQSGFAIADAGEVHALWAAAEDHQSVGHEMTHVITAQTLGEPSEALLGEGVAVCLDHSGWDHHAEAAALLAQGRLAPLAQVLGDAWFDQEPEVIYPESGSFVCYLLETYGVERFQRLYPQAHFQEGLTAIYGTDLNSLEQEWLSSLQRPPKESDANRATPTAVPPAMVQFALANTGSMPICYVFISPSTADTWGEDRLGAEEIILPDARREFSLEPGVYDLKLYDCDGNVLVEEYGIPVQDGAVWTFDGVQPRPETRIQPTPASTPISTPPPSNPLPTPAPLDAFLCCGSTPGETGTIWSVRYPAGWTVTLLPNNPQEFYGAFFTDPGGHVTITWIPGANTEPGHPLDTGNVDDWLNRFVGIRQQEETGFQEFMREPVAGVPSGRLWAATWGQGESRGWEAYLVTVDPVPAVAPGLPQGYLTMYGVRATSRDWNNATAIYTSMFASMQIKRFGVVTNGPSEPTVKPFLVRWCATTCDWMAVDADSEDWVGDCGEPTSLWETTCHPRQEGD